MSETTAQGIARAELEARLLELTSLLAVEYDDIRERDMEQLAARSADVSALLTDPDAPAGQQLHALLSRAQQANRTNGAAIESSQLFTTSLLDILRGRAPGERTYTSRGRLGAQAETMTLVRI